MTKEIRDILRIDRHDEVAVVWIDDPERSVNTVGQAFIERLAAMLDVFEDDPPGALVFTSAKPDFCVGADLQMLREPTAVAAAEGLAGRLQGLYSRLANLACPTAVALSGKCLGAGLELALSCDLRVGDATCRLGASEIKLGLCPGAGATQRLPRLVGLEQALELLLSGRSVDCTEAEEIGLLDVCTDGPIALSVALERVRQARERPLRRNGDETLSERLRTALLEGNPVGRRMVLERARDQARSKTKDNIPAVDRIVDAIRIGLFEGVDAGMAAEAKAFGELQATPEARQLIRLFFMGRELDTEDPTAAEVQPLRVESVGMIGAGLMGTGIAYVSSKGGLRVRLTDLDSRALIRATDRIATLTEREVSKGKLTPFEGRKLQSRITLTTGDEGLGHSQLVIEAVVEDLPLKQEVLRQCEARGTSATIFATNTSAIPIARIAEGCERPERVVGMHYFSPVEKMPLLEIVRTAQTDPEVIETCVDVGRRQGKKVIVVNDGVGFYTTRILAAYMAAACRLLTRGVPIEDVDEALEQWGFPMGPFALADRVGVALAVDIASTMSELGDRFALPAALTKADQTPSFYDEGTRRERPNARVYELLGRPDRVAMDPETLAWHCVLPMVDEALRCLDEGVLRSERDGDAGAIFGLGYPPFRGGPFQTIAAWGPNALAARMDEYDIPRSEALDRRAREVDDKRLGAAGN